MRSENRRFVWPPLSGRMPVWTGHGFRVGNEVVSVLDYQAGTSGWTEDLTRFHEESAGEGTHPIDVASRRHARAAIRRHLRGRPEESVILEIGSSSGFLVQELRADWPNSLVIGSDFILNPLQRLAARLPTLPLLRFDMVKCPLPSESVDAVVLLNVLEHIEDHEEALRQVARILRPRGIAVVEVPAGPQLYDVYDKYLQHWRRYRLREVCQLLNNAGLRVASRSHLGFLAYPAFALVKRRNRRWLSAPEEKQRAIVAESITQSGRGPFLKWTIAIESLVGRWLSFPVGIRCLAVAVK